jgi:hypothetical protein
MGRSRLRQHPVVGHTPLHPEERQPEHQQQRDNHQADRHRESHHELRRPVPKQPFDRFAHRVGPAEYPAAELTDVQGIQPRPEQHDRRGCHEDRGHRDERDRGHARISE